MSTGVFTLNTSSPMPRVPAGLTAWTPDWMALYGRCMHDRTLRDLTLPGTHDSGSYGIPKPHEFTKTQDLDFQGQLSAGVRYFDMRVGYQPQYDDDRRFILVHEAAKSDVTLAAALAEMTAFLSAHPAEIFILDFHRFTNFAFSPPHYDDSGFGYAELAYDIREGLGTAEFDIPSGMDATQVTLDDVYATAGRVLVSFNSSYYPNTAYIPAITQVWQGSSAYWNTRHGLKKFIACVLDNNPDDCPDNKPVPIPTGIWAMMAAINFPPITHPQSLAPDIDHWFYGGSSWSMKCNAIPTDFVEKTALVSNSVCTSVLKGTNPS